MRFWCRGLADCTEASVFGVVKDVGLSTEGEVDWVATKNSIDVDAVIECVVYAVWDGPCAVHALLRLGFMVFVEFGLCFMAVCDVNGFVFVCEFR